jgi:anti-sigma regulatory factor (Ser/Thr protein kinase)
MQRPVSFELTVPVDTDAELVAAATAEKIASLAGIDERERSMIRIAVTEACGNRFEHGGDFVTGVNLTFIRQENRLLIILRVLGTELGTIQMDPSHIQQLLAKLRPGQWQLLMWKLTTIVGSDPGA